MNFDRNHMMSDRFVDHDQKGVKMMQDIWMQLVAMGAKAPPTPEPVIDSFIRDVKLQTDKIKARGGEVVFLRPRVQVHFGRLNKWDSPEINFGKKSSPLPDVKECTFRIIRN